MFLLNFWNRTMRSAAKSLEAAMAEAQKIAADRSTYVTVAERVETGHVEHRGLATPVALPVHRRRRSTSTLHEDIEASYEPTEHAQPPPQEPPTPAVHPVPPDPPPHDPP